MVRLVKPGRWNLLIPHLALLIEGNNISSSGSWARYARSNRARTASLFVSSHHLLLIIFLRNIRTGCRGKRNKQTNTAWHSFIPRAPANPLPWKKISNFIMIIIIWGRGKAGVRARWVLRSNSLASKDVRVIRWDYRKILKHKSGVAIEGKFCLSWVCC